MSIEARGKLSRPLTSRHLHLPSAGASGYHFPTDVQSVTSDLAETPAPLYPRTLLHTLYTILNSFPEPRDLHYSNVPSNYISLFSSGTLREFCLLDSNLFQALIRYIAIILENTLESLGQVTPKRLLFKVLLSYFIFLLLKSPKHHRAAKIIHSGFMDPIIL